MRSVVTAQEPFVVVLSRPGCHLCEVAVEIVSKVCADLHVSWSERDITGDAELERDYGEQIPVTFVGGTRHDVWRVDETRLRQALEEHVHEAS